MLERDTTYFDYYPTTPGGWFSAPTIDPHTLVVIFHGRLGSITSQKFHCPSREHAEDVLDKLQGMGVMHTEHEILKGLL